MLVLVYVWVRVVVLYIVGLCWIKELSWFRQVGDLERNIVCVWSVLYSMILVGLITVI